MEQAIQSVLLNEHQLAVRVQELGRQISADYKGKNLLLVCILKGSVVFTADLMRALRIPCSLDFMRVSSYGSGVKTSGQVRVPKDLEQDVCAYDVLLVEDILDSGRTLSCLKSLLAERHPKSIRICTLLDKPERREVADLQADYIGFQIPDAFVVGYGLDYDERYRSLPYIGILKPEVYADTRTPD